MDSVVGIVVGVVALWALALVVLWLVRPRDVRLAELVGVIPDVVRLVRDLIRDPEVPWPARLALGILIAWILSPIDLVPEFIPVLGPLDDVVVAVLVLRFVRRRVGDDELRARWRGTPAGWALLSRLLGGAAPG